jgi:hypothetical protein
MTRKLSLKTFDWKKSFKNHRFTCKGIRILFTILHHTMKQHKLFNCFVTALQGKGTYHYNSLIIAHRFPCCCSLLFPMVACTHKPYRHTFCVLYILAQQLLGCCKCKSNLAFKVCCDRVLMCMTESNVRVSFSFSLFPPVGRCAMKSAIYG